MAPFLEFTNITKSFPGVRALKELSFSVPSGRVIGLLGENGAGKSTLIKILGGDYTPDTGELRIGGKAHRFSSTRDSIAAGVTVVHQELQLVPELTVAENLMLGRFPSRFGVVRYGELFAKVGAVLREAGIEVDPRAKVADLSLGTRQMVEIAKAAIFDASVIALDEPTSSLSAHESEVLFRLVNRLRAAGKVILYVSHRLDEIFRLCDGCVVLRDGRLVAQHDTLEGLTRETLVREMVGREIQDIWGWRPRTPGAVRLSVSGLEGSRLTAPTGFEVRAGEILGLFGLVGAGRSELARLLYGADPRAAGEVRIDGVPVRIHHPRQAVRAGLVLCPEDRKADGILQGQSVEANIAISSRRHFSPFGILNTRREGEMADRFIQRLGVRTPSREQAIENLSGGNQQKVILSRWLSEQGIKVFIVDEPTRGIDVGAKSEIYEVLYGLAEQGIALIVISSELPEVMGISDRIAVMCGGRIAAEFQRPGFSEEKILAAALPDRTAA
ncbi:monosaccharide ABC transporter ATP-binding protein, CUT2 family [Stigmatella aurantiaca]|uniref:Monosaccharide ABC transporter ATP-binding protein, CUT2 family n=1 Tax=Stigmatella aurantiaca TaxID=41 RepID=A0A1H7VFV3_STIAU|nr:L-arabinose ABC transporter ATP-binding protein AraG [Stigmatella aurantiaca]SEM07960.1 monosaccharide ABC transporter ATP-binding protein, CUT2 family [Stigmatella aurantiaca]